MSADNYLYVDKKNRVWNCVASCTSENIENQKISCIGVGNNLEEAMNIAEKYEKELEKNGSYVEYGIHRKLWCK